MNMGNHAIIEMMAMHRFTEAVKKYGMDPIKLGLAVQMAEPGEFDQSTIKAIGEFLNSYVSKTPNA